MAKVPYLFRRNNIFYFRTRISLKFQESFKAKADDHDMGIKSKLTPFGILDVMTGFFTIIFGVSFETSDFIVDCLEQCWDANKERYEHIRQLVINLG